MKIKEAKAEIWFQGIEENHIAKCARVCYASENINNIFKFCNQLWKNKHKSMFRHAGVYYKIPTCIGLPETACKDVMIILHHFDYYVSTNRQAAKEIWHNKYAKYEVPFIIACRDKIFRDNKMLRYTFCIETGIDITREYNRKSPNNIAEQSTRYVDFNKKIGIVFKKCHWMYEINLWKKFLTYSMCKISEWFYKISRSKYGLNLKPQDARWILPLDTMSKVVYTYTIKDWEYIINMRLFDWTGKAHPDAKIVAQYIKDEIEKLGYKIENYKENEAKSVVQDI